MSGGIKARRSLHERWRIRSLSGHHSCEHMHDAVVEMASEECEALRALTEANTEDATNFAELTTEVLAEVRSQLAGLHRSVEALEAENLSLRAELDRLRIKVQGPRLVD